MIFSGSHAGFDFHPGGGVRPGARGRAVDAVVAGGGGVGSGGDAVAVVTGGDDSVTPRFASGLD